MRRTCSSRSSSDASGTAKQCRPALRFLLRLLERSVSVLLLAGVRVRVAHLLGELDEPDEDVVDDESIVSYVSLSRSLIHDSHAFTTRRKTSTLESGTAYNGTGERAVLEIRFIISEANR